MRAGSGVWHTGGVYLGASAFNSAGPARVIAGEYEGIKSAVASPPGMTYLDVRLSAGERWMYRPPNNHNVAWIASHQGTVFTPSEVSAGEAVVFEEAEKPIRFEAVTDTQFVLGSAVKHPFDLVTGHHSVHTTAEALRQGESNIASIGRRLHNQGVLGPKAKMTARREGARR
jgi:redox-sensitive bicupin YhaK (pirin superfamily)